MKSFLNDTGSLLSESLMGFAAAHAELVTYFPDGNFMRRRHINPGKVAIISGGGSGHEPLHCGFVGFGMLDAACPGHMFTSPTPDQIVKAALSANGGAGTIFIVKNYSGDVLNFDVASEMMPGGAKQIIVCDDIATGPQHNTRRGIAGTVIVQKLVGAAAEQGMALEQVFAIGTKANLATRTIGVALEGSFNPATQRRSFTLEANEIEFGVGIHGEPGMKRVKHKSADEIAADMCEAILANLRGDLKKPALLLVNGLGSTPLNELYLIYAAARQILEKAGVSIVRSLVGNYVTSLNMVGCSITLTSLDDELLRFWDAPVATPALTWGFKPPSL